MLRVQNLHRDPLQPVSLQLPAASCVGLHGPSGSGKTLLLRAIADLDVNTGDVWLDNVPRQDIAPAQWRRRVAYLPAESGWWGETVGEHSSGWSTDQLAALGFEPDVLHWQISRLSSGERQRLGLLRLLNGHPDVLLLDEPTANLDNTNTAAVEKLLGDYIASQRTAALWVSHDPEQRQRVAGISYELHAGSLRA